VRVEPEQRTTATFLLAVDEHGGVLGFASEDNPEGHAMIREAAERANVVASVVLVEMPLPPGSGSAAVTALEA
jgi:hypothetical protein